MLPFHKALPVFLLPLGFSILLIALAAKTRRRTPALTAALLLYALGTPVISDVLLRSLEDQYRDTPIPTADAIICLSGIVHEVTPGQIEWGDGVDRFEKALQLYTDHKAPIIIFSGNHQSRPDFPTSEGDLLKQVAIRRGIPPDAILVTPPVLNTADESRAYANLAAQRHLQQVLLVTSAFHMPRALYLFRNAGLNAIPAPTDYLTDPPNAPRNFEIQRYLPQANALARSETALREHLGLAFYRLLKWIRS